MNVNSKKDCLQVIYVAGTSYSGSTILGAILGMHPAVESPGEIRAWVLDDSEKDLPVPRSGEGWVSFWGAIKDRLLPDMPDASWRSFKELIKTYEEFRSIAVLVIQKLFGRSGTFRKYVTYNASLFSVIQQATSKDIIVDTSKKPVRTLALSMVDGIEVVCVHLMKSPTAYADSVTRRRVDQWVQSGRKPAELVHKAVMNWVGNNVFAELAIWLGGVRAVRVRYEDFSQDPSTALKAIGGLVGLDLGQLAQDLENGTLVDPKHILGSSLVLKGRQTFVRKEAVPYKPVDVRGPLRLIARFLERRYGYL